MMLIKMYCLLLLLFGTVVSIHTEHVEVSTKSGPVLGETIVEEGRSLTRFLGIPYAKPPVGKLRFRRPVPPKPWQQQREALQWPDNCVQTILELEPPEDYLTQNFSEDCLYLNIWSPDVRVEETKLRPVLFWIHGGGLVLGSAAFHIYDGRTLAAMSDAVVVSINYRLSTLGYLYSDEVEDVKGNQGFWDQKLALEWVRDNIRSFGGDPSRVTIFGESAGSWSVSAHILSPASRHLFQNAYMMSGSVTFGAVDDAKTIVTKQLKGIRAIGCATESDTTISQKVVECLEQLEPEKVDKIYYLSAPIFHSVGVIDGEFMPASPSEMLASGNHKKDFNLMVSTVEDEGSSLLFFLDSTPSSLARFNPKSITMNEAQQHLYKLVAENLEVKPHLRNETIGKIYFNGLNNQVDKQDLFRKQVGVAFGDFFITCPTVDFAKWILRNSADTVQVYQWLYSAKMGMLKLECSEWAGTCHGDDLYPVFGMPFQNRSQYLTRERDISREVIGFLKSFVYTGTPGEEQSEWQSYFLSEDGQRVVAPYYELGNQPKSHSNFQLDFKHTECNLWNNYY